MGGGSLVGDQMGITVFKCGILIGTVVWVSVSFNYFSVHTVVKRQTVHRNHITSILDFYCCLFDLLNSLKTRDRFIYTLFKYI